MCRETFFLYSRLACPIHFFFSQSIQNETDQPTMGLLCLRAIGHYHSLLHCRNINYWYCHPPRRTSCLLCRQIRHQDRYVFPDSRHSDHVFFMVVLWTPLFAQYQPYRLQLRPISFGLADHYRRQSSRSPGTYRKNELLSEVAGIFRKACHHRTGRTP